MYGLCIDMVGLNFNQYEKGWGATCRDMRGDKSLDKKELCS